MRSTTFCDAYLIGDGVVCFSSCRSHKKGNNATAISWEIFNQISGRVNGMDLFLHIIKHRLIIVK